MNKEAQTSLLDFLQDAIPELQHFTLLVKPGPSSDPNVQRLYDIWSDVQNKVADRKFLRPPTMSGTEVSKLESSGLVEVQGKYLKVTSKGVDAIKSMILHSEKSSFNKSASSAGMTKVAQQQQMADQPNNWYGQQRAIEQSRVEESISAETETEQDEPSSDDISD